MLAVAFPYFLFRFAYSFRATHGVVRFVVSGVTLAISGWTMLLSAWPLAGGAEVAPARRRWRGDQSAIQRLRTPASTSVLTGLVTKASIPASKQRAWSSFMALAVMAMIGTRSVFWARIWRVAS